MIEIIPNWHPIAVHFTFALLTLAVALHFVAPVLPANGIRDELMVVARWSLWIGTLLAVVTAIAGWYAYNSVAHDAVSHAAMTDHRNWALATLALFVLLASWSSVLWWRKRALARGVARVVFLVALFSGGILLASTAWRGAELVYRYGLGVMSLPAVESEEAGHGHAQSEGLPQSDHADMTMPESPIHDSATHTHDH